jgi:hypothetical protein
MNKILLKAFNGFYKAFLTLVNNTFKFKYLNKICAKSPKFYCCHPVFLKYLCDK